LGTFSDKVGRKKILILSLFSNAIIYAVSAWTIVLGCYLLFIIMRLFSGFFSGSFEIAQLLLQIKAAMRKRQKICPILFWRLL